MARIILKEISLRFENGLQVQAKHLEESIPEIFIEACIFKGIRLEEATGEISLNLFFP